MKQKYFFIILLIVVLAGFFIIPRINLPYTIRSRAVVYPAREWSLIRAGDGQLAYSLSDNYNNTVSDYTITEFQRGDHGQFILREGIFSRETINKGDTIGVIHSNEERRRLIQLQGELETRQRLFDVYQAGERAQDVSIAYEMMVLAQKEYQNQQNLMDRAEKLYQEDVIPSQEYEIARNEYEIKQMAFQIARSQYEAVRAGAKPEQLHLVESEIRALKSQINQVMMRLDAFTIVAPFAGKIIRDRQQEINNTTFIRIAEDSKFIAVLPVEVHQLEYVQEGQKITLLPENRAQQIQATVTSIGNSVQLINRRQNVFLTAVIDENQPGVLPGMIINADIHTGDITLKEYATRLMRTIYAN